MTVLICRNVFHLDPNSLKNSGFVTLHTRGLVNFFKFAFINGIIKILMFNFRYLLIFLVEIKDVIYLIVDLYIPSYSFSLSPV